MFDALISLFIDVFYCLIGAWTFSWCFSHRLSPMFQNLDCKSPGAAVMWKYSKNFESCNISYSYDSTVLHCFQETQMEVETSIAWGSLSAGTVATRPYKALHKADWQKRRIGEWQDRLITLHCDQIVCKLANHFPQHNLGTNVFLEPSAFSVQTMKEKQIRIHAKAEQLRPS